MAPHSLPQLLRPDLGGEKTMEDYLANRWRKCMGIEPTYPLIQKVHRI